jgi:signal transduction histidine kinase
MLPVLVLLVAVAGRFPFKLSPQGDASMFTVPLFMAALLLHPLEALLVGMVGSLISERLLKAPVRVAIFNTSVSAVIAGLAGIVFWSLSPDTADQLFTPGGVVAAVSAGLVLHIANLLLVAAMVTIRKGLAFWRRWKETWAFDSIQEGGLLILALIGAQLVMLAWWWLLLLLVPFVLAFYGFKHSVEEVVQKARLAEELEGKLEELKATQAELIRSAKLASVGTLAAGVAHEINNPLFVITGRAELFLEMLKRRDPYIHTQQAIEDMEAIIKMGMHIADIVKEVLAYSRHTATPEELHLDKVMEESLALLERKIATRGVQIVKEYQPSPKVTAVANQLQQVFVNLMINALDATPEWGRITLGCTSEDGMAVGYIKDTGVGMTAEVQDRIFEPFFTTKEVGKGTGLGLFICHKIVTDHQGQISVESKPGKGTTVLVKLPALQGVDQGQVSPELVLSGDR